MMDFEGNNPDGIFVVNGQVFSINDLLNVMRRHGMRIRVNANGLYIDGEQINSITNFNDNKCPLAKTCEKRVALIEFLKLQKNQQQSKDYSQRDFSYESEPQSFYQDTYEDSNDQDNYFEQKEDKPRRDFIRPNNHDLFEGNVEESRGLFDEPVTEARGLFDEPDLFSESETSNFEDSFYKERPEHFDDRREPNDNPYRENTRDNRSFTRDNPEQPFCAECGFDLKPSWVSCPNCGYRIIRKKRPSERNFRY